MKINLFFVALINLNFIIVSNTYAQDQSNIPLTKPIILLADNQEHERNGTFTFLAGSMADKVSKVAIRSPRQDLYTKDVMKYILEKYKADEKLLSVHLGDFLDISCRSEWNRIFPIMKEYITQDRLAFGLGNHDGFYLGNYAFSEKEKGDIYTGEASWRDRCDAGKMSESDHKNTDRGIWDKTKILNAFKNLSSIKDLEKKSSFNCVDGMQCETTKINKFWKIYSQNVPNSKSKYGFGKEGVLNFWRSYMISEVTMPNDDLNNKIQIKIIILDSSQALKPVSKVSSTIFSWFIKPSILYGTILKEQRNLVEKIINNECEVEQCLYLIAGHHPYGNYKISDRRWVNKLISSNANVIPIFLSAHTHTGYLRDYGNFKELNIGSLIENNPNFRTIQIFKNIDNSFAFKSDYISINTYLNTGIKNESCQKFDRDIMDENLKLNFKDEKDKLKYLQNTMSALILELEAIKKESEKNEMANIIWNQKNEESSLKMIQNQMNMLLNRTVANEGVKIYQECKNDINSIQHNYWLDDTYKNGQNILNILKRVQNDFQKNTNLMDNCKGVNNGKTYLAYSDTFFLSFIQDWLESLPKEALPANYRVCQHKHTIDIDDKIEKHQDQTYKNTISIRF